MNIDAGWVSDDTDVTCAAWASLVVQSDGKVLFAAVLQEVGNVDEARPDDVVLADECLVHHSYGQAVLCDVLTLVGVAAREEGTLVVPFGGLAGVLIHARFPRLVPVDDHHIRVHFPEDLCVSREHRIHRNYLYHIHYFLHVL